MANEPMIYTSTNWCIPGTVMKSAFFKDKLSICCLNSQSICARKFCKVEELRKIAEVSNVDIICVSETWLTDRTNNSVVAIDGYEIVRHDRIGRIGGGILLYIKTGIHFNVISKSNYEIGTAHTEFVATEIVLQNDKILLTALYNPPEVDCTTSLEFLLSSYGFNYEHIFLLGDLIPIYRQIHPGLRDFKMYCLRTLFQSWGVSQLSFIEMAHLNWI